MCVIVDANRASMVFGTPAHPDAKPIWAWLQNRGGVLVYGGKLAAELKRSARTGRLLAELKRASRAMEFDWRRVAAEEMSVRPRCCSDDPHVIALARVSGARVLVSDDDAAAADFKDRRLVYQPRGKVYKRREHAKLLKHSTGCTRPS
jgi:hypothetical protein